MSNHPFPFQPVIIIGAARSGTNMLRDMLTRLPGVATWPCDEINYVWRHGNASVPHDELSESLARPRVQRAIRRRFARMAAATSSTFLVEKTCANSLRVPFVEAVVPEAKYLFLVRDGRDVVASALKRWKAPLDLRYVLKKARFVPPTDLPYYALRYLGHRVYRAASRARRLKSWGPRFVDMDTELGARPLDEVCALQWSRSVDAADAALRRIPSDRVHRLSYEELVGEPRLAFRGVLDALGIAASFATVDNACRDVFANSVGAYRRDLSADQIARVESAASETLGRFGYVNPRMKAARAA